MAIAMTCYASHIISTATKLRNNKHMLLTKRYIPGTAAMSMSSHTGLDKAVNKGEGWFQ